MKLVLDDSIAAKWYLHDADVVKALKLRFDFHMHRHELLAPDTFHSHCADTLVTAERKGGILPGEAALNLNDLLLVGVALHPSAPLLPRAVEISLSTRLSVFASLYVALAEREKCQLLTADQKVIRSTRKK